MGMAFESRAFEEALLPSKLRGHMSSVEVNSILQFGLRAVKSFSQKSSDIQKGLFRKVWKAYEGPQGLRGAASP